MGRNGHRFLQSGESGTIRESNQTSGERIRRIVRKSSILLAGTGVRKISSLACGLIYYSVNRIIEPYVFQ